MFFFKVIATLNRPAADPVVYTLPLMGSAIPITTILIVYALVVLKYGKKIMDQRQAFDIKKVMIVYNILQVIYNSAIFFSMLYYMTVEPLHNLRCMETLPFDHRYKNVERYINYAYFINKVVDLLDTIFFVLRKSYKQITGLHVFHHILMPVGTFWVVRLYGVGGPFVIMAFLNSFVHTFMYFYYMISAIYTGLKGSLWWKKYITKIQIIQFILVMVNPSYVLLFNPGCKCPVFFQYFLLVCGLTFVLLFSNFYINAYIKPQKQKQQ